MARNFVGVLRPGSSDAARARRNGHHHGIVGPERYGVAAEFQTADPACRHAEFAQFVAEPDAAALAVQQLDRGIDQNRAQALAGDQRPAGLAARKQGFAHDRAGKTRRALGRIDVQRRQQQRLHQPLIQRSLARDGVTHQLARPAQISGMSAR